MKRGLWSLAVLWLALWSNNYSRAEEAPLAQSFEYAAAMKRVAGKFSGRVGVVLHVGDSITYSNPYGAWARYGAGKTDDDKAVLAWMHAGKDDDSDGWWLCRVDLPGGRSHTACSGIRLNEMLAGGRNNMLSLAQLVEKYQPQAVVLMLGTNDASAGRKVDEFQRDFQQAVELLTKAGVVPIVSTIPPHVGKRELAREFSETIRTIAKERQLPVIDFEQEILKRRPDDWDGTLLNKGDVHPNTGIDGTKAASAPTAENLRNSGYLLRGWLSVKKIAEVKRKVFDAASRDAAQRDPMSAPTSKAAARPAAPQGRAVKLPVTRDVLLCNEGQQANGNNGGSARWKLKSNQEMTLFDIDAASLRGHVINGATLHVRSQGEPSFQRVTVSSVGAEWVEGTATSYGLQAGSSTFNARRHPDVPWTIPGSDLCSVILGQGGTQWRNADAFPPDEQGWQRIAIEPSIVAARVAGVSHGFLAFDDTGTEWTRSGEKYQSQHFPNRYAHSRESRASAPYLTVFVGDKDEQPPAVPSDLRSTTETAPLVMKSVPFAGEAGPLPAGEALVSWTTPNDVGPAGTLGFLVRVAERDVPRYLIPLAGRPGERVQMRLRDLGLAAGATVAVSIRAVDAAGNVGPAAEFSVKVSDYVAPALPGQRATFDVTTAPLPKLGAATVAVIDELDKVHPVTGEMLPAQPASYLAANHLWNAKTQQIRWAAARNEFVACQLVLQGNVDGVRAELAFPTLPKATVTFGRYVNVSTAKGPLPDPIVPVSDGFVVPSKVAQSGSQDNTPKGRDGIPTSSSVLCEVFVPHEASEGEHEGKLTLRAGSSVLTLGVRLRVWEFSLPDVLSFLPEMNCYDLPTNAVGYYRQAHRHRTVLNRVPYHQNGRVSDGCAPRWNGRSLDWTEWDRRFGPLLDGSAFADLPRANVPLDCFYLPLHENWPTPIDAHYNGDYWADRAFTPEYRAAFVSASQQFAEHMQARGWHQTLFQFFLNGKNHYKENGWSRASSPWTLDEPSNFQDYWALAWFGQAFHEGVRQAKLGDQKLGSGSSLGPKLLFRADISRPQWQRDCFDGLLDFNVVSGALRNYERMVLDRRAAQGELVVEYGGTNAITDANVQPLGWCLDAWSLGADGVLPWQTVGQAKSWTEADELSLFYPPRGNEPEPIPSIRLKAYRRGQQDVEYLTLLAQHLKQPRWAIGQRVREALRLSGQRRGTGFVGGEDAGLLHYSKLLPQDVWSLRMQIGEALSQAKLPARRQLIDLRTPARTKTASLTSLVSVGELPPPSASRFEVASAATAAPSPLTSVVKVLQGRNVVRDALIDFQQPTKNFGSVPRDNAVRRAEQSNAFLVRFDVRSLGLPANARITRARLSCYVWDPSSRGNTKLAAFPLRTAWDEATITWQQPSANKQWLGGESFSLAKDVGPEAAFVIVKPDQGSDTAEPPLEITLDITETVRRWQSGQLPNEGLALIPIADRTIDEGNHTRLQFYASEHPRVAFTPKLTLEISHTAPSGSR